MRKIAVLFLLIVFVFSCEQTELERPSNNITVQEVQDHFNNFVTNHPNARVNSLDIVWDMAQFREISTGEAIVFPMEFPENQYISGADGIKVKISQTTFAFAYEIQNEIHLQIVKQIPTKVTTKFTGYMLVENLEGETIRYFEFEDGEFIEEYVIGAEPENGRVTCEITEYYTCTVRTDGPDDCTLDRTSLSCKYAPTLAGPDPNGGDYGGGGVSGDSDSLECGDGYFENAEGTCEEARCDPGHVKNINNKCVPCPDGDCSNCSNGEFRDICGNCVSEVISTPSHVEGRCNGIRLMSVMQSETGKEVTGFFTIDQQMIILPNANNSSHGSETSNIYRDENHKITHSIYEENGKLYIDYYNADNILTTVEIIGHYHTHPFGGQWSPNDQNFVNGNFAAAGNFYFLDGNNIRRYNEGGVIGNEYVNCKKNPENTECN